MACIRNCLLPPYHESVFYDPYWNSKFSECIRILDMDPDYFSSWYCFAWKRRWTMDHDRKWRGANKHVRMGRNRNTDSLYTLLFSFYPIDFLVGKRRNNCDNDRNALPYGNYDISSFFCQPVFLCFCQEILYKGNSCLWLLAPFSLFLVGLTGINMQKSDLRGE